MTSDLQSRLRTIEAEMEKLEKTEIPPTKEDVQRLAYGIAYIAAVLRKHLETNER